MRALVLGGTGFIARRLVEDLLRAGDEVSVVTTGKSPNPFGARVRSVRADRTDRAGLRAAVAPLGRFDVVFDQLCFDPEDAASTLELCGAQADRCVFVSSGAVYAEGAPPYRETAFDPLGHSVRAGRREELGYGEGKRSAEAFLFQRASIPVAAARFPNVLGHDDSTGRFQWHAERVRDGGPIVIPPGAGKSTCVWVEDAGRFLAWLGRGSKRGPYNAASRRVVDANDLVEGMGRALDRTPRVLREGDEADRSSYRGSTSLLSVEKAESEGFRFTPFEEWFPLELARFSRR